MYHKNATTHVVNNTTFAIDFINSTRPFTEKILPKPLIIFNFSNLKPRALGDFRGLWIQRINAGVREHGLTYAKFIDGLKKANIEINRKILSEIAFHEPAQFKSIVEKAKSTLAS